MTEKQKNFHRAAGAASAYLITAFLIFLLGFNPESLTSQNMIIGTLVAALVQVIIAYKNA